MEKVRKSGVCIVDALETSAQTEGFNKTWAKYETELTSISVALQECRDKSDMSLWDISFLFSLNQHHLEFQLKIEAIMMNTFQIFSCVIDLMVELKERLPLFIADLISAVIVSEKFRKNDGAWHVYCLLTTKLFFQQHGAKQAVGVLEPVEEKCKTHVGAQQVRDILADESKQQK